MKTFAGVTLNSEEAQVLRAKLAEQELTPETLDRIQGLLK